MKALSSFSWSVVQDAFHRKVFYVILAITIILIMLIPLLPSAEVGIQIDLMREAGLGMASIMVFLLAVVLGSTIIPGEINKRTIYNTLSRPVRRWEYFIGKLLGIMLVLAVVMIFTFMIFLLFILAKFGLFNPGLAKAFLTMYLEAGILAAVAMAFSVNLGPVVCIFLTGLFYVICHVKGDFLYKAMTEAGNNLFVRGLAGIGYYVLPNLERLNVNEAIAHGERVYGVGARELMLLAGVAVIFTAVFTCAGVFMLKRRDL
ncbi:MAG: ABC transporter permease subunit [Actinomycetota bacterium]|nr:ABC transporter permease subunit [Actinomycetota bacterium]